MRNRILLIFAVLALGFFYHGFRAGRAEFAAPSGVVGSQQRQVISSVGPTFRRVAEGPAESARSGLEQNPLSVSETHAVASLFSEFKKATQPEMTVSIFSEQLKAAGLVPTIFVSNNADTGALSILRTEKSLPGTRYLHAQFFLDEHHRSVMQHISFEIRPGADAMDQAIRLAKETFGLETEHFNQAGDFVEWHRNGRTLSIKKLTDPEELTSDPFNARTLADSGTVVVALEADPHTHEK